jgi:hypothetical protein
MDANVLHQLFGALNHSATPIGPIPVYGVPIIDNIHNYFPDILYNNTRFTSLPALMEYLRNQMNHHFNIYNRMYMEYWRNNAPDMSNSVSPSRSAQAVPTTPNIQAMPREMQEALDALLNPLGSNISTRTATPVLHPMSTYMDDELLLNGFATPLQPTSNNAPPSINRLSTALNSIFPGIGEGRPAVFMAARAYHIRPLNLNVPETDGLTPLDIQRSTHIAQRIEGQCPICYDDYSGNDLRIINTCNHAFHIECIDRWFQNHNTCPMCRANVLAPPLDHNILINNNQSEYSADIGE